MPLRVDAFGIHRQVSERILVWYLTTLYGRVHILDKDEVRTCFKSNVCLFLSILCLRSLSCWNTQLCPGFNLSADADEIMWNIPEVLDYSIHLNRITWLIHWRGGLATLHCVFKCVCAWILRWTDVTSRVDFCPVPGVPLDRLQILSDPDLNKDKWKSDLAWK